MGDNRMGSVCHNSHVTGGLLMYELCERCKKPTNGMFLMSWFNTQTICLKCSEKELKRPDINEAKEAENKALREGNRNFKGIGLNRK